MKGQTPLCRNHRILLLAVFFIPIILLTYSFAPVSMIDSVQNPASSESSSDYAGKFSDIKKRENSGIGLAENGESNLRTMEGVEINVTSTWGMV